MNQAQVEFDIKKMEREAAIKKELMLHEFQLNVKLKEMDLQEYIKQLVQQELDEMSVSGDAGGSQSIDLDFYHLFCQ